MNDILIVSQLQSVWPNFMSVRAFATWGLAYSLPIPANIHYQQRSRASGPELKHWFLHLQSPRAKFWRTFLQGTGEKCGEILTFFFIFADFRPSISRENGRKKCHENSSTSPRNSSTSSTVHHVKFLHSCNSGSSLSEQHSQNSKRLKVLARNEATKNRASGILYQIVPEVQVKQLFGAKLVQKPIRAKGLQH